MSRGITTSLIVKNCPSSLDECLASLREFINRDLGDELIVVDTGSTDNGKTIKVARKHGARVIERPDLCSGDMLELVKKYLPEHYEEFKNDPQFSGGFLSNFSAARQIAYDAASNDLQFWIDSDDVLVGGSKLREMTGEFFAKPENAEHALFVRYDYTFDPDGQCNTVLWRERIVDRRYHEWLGSCHEANCPKDKRPRSVWRCPDPKVYISHKNFRHHTFSDFRNYAILRHDYDNSDWKDPRHEFYLGNACRGLKRFHEAVLWYSKLLKRSGNRDDRFSAALNIAAIYLLVRRPWFALDWCWQASKIYPSEPRVYYLMARCNYELKRYQEALFWTHVGRTLPTPQHVTAVDPQAFDFYPSVFEALSLKELGELAEARQVATKTLQLRPNFPPAQSLHEEIKAAAQRQATKKAVFTTTNLTASKERATKVITSLAPEVRRQFREFQLEQKNPTPPNKPSIVFLCGKTVEPWDETSLDSGIGGSEQMAIRLARAWAQKGIPVHVYGNPKNGNEYKTFNGVTYRPIESFNPSFPRDIVLAWRTPQFVDYGIRANAFFVELHDVQQPDAWTPERLSRIDGVLVKSEFHAESIRETIGDKLIITRNGIDPNEFRGEPLQRDFGKIIFTSSGDRGLLGSLRIWARIYNEFPNASFHWFYGFTPLYISRANDVEYQYFWDEGCERHMLDYSEECFRLTDRIPRTFNRGRISPKDLVKEFQTASIWLYPTGFHEISCMGAMESQAAGCVPVCSNTGALKETVFWNDYQHDYRDSDAFVRSIRDVFKRGTDLNDKRAQASAEALNRFDIHALADEWLSHFERAASVRRS